MDYDHVKSQSVENLNHKFNLFSNPQNVIKKNPKFENENFNFEELNKSLSSPQVVNQKKTNPTSSAELSIDEIELISMTDTFQKKGRIFNNELHKEFHQDDLVLDDQKDDFFQIIKTNNDIIFKTPMNRFDSMNERNDDFYRDHLSDDEIIKEDSVGSRKGYSEMAPLSLKGLNTIERMNDDKISPKSMKSKLSPKYNSSKTDAKPLEKKKSSTKKKRAKTMRSPRRFDSDTLETRIRRRRFIKIKKIHLERLTQMSGLSPRVYYDDDSSESSSSFQLTYRSDTESIKNDRYLAMDIDFSRHKSRVRQSTPRPSRSSSQLYNHVNFWDENTDQSFVMEDKINFSYRSSSEMARKGGQGLYIKYASLNRLIEHLTWPDYNEDDKLFSKVFLNTFEMFTTPEMILLKLKERMHVPRDRSISKSEWMMRFKSPIQSRVCSVLKMWIDNFGSLLTIGFIEKLEQFMQDELKSVQQLPIVKILSKSIEVRLRKDVEFSIVPSGDAFKPNKREQLKKSISESDIFSRQKIIHPLEMIPIEDIARHFTYHDYRLFNHIKPWELINRVWEDDQIPSNESPLKNLVDRFNLISNFVISMILEQDKVKNRAKIMSIFIKIAKCLKKMNNFNSTMAILSGLNHSCIQRLVETFNHTSKRSIKSLKKMERFMSLKNNFGKYREFLSDNEGPCIPYLGLIIADYTFIHEGNSDFVDHMINFSKAKQVYFNCLDVIMQHQNRGDFGQPYNDDRIEKLLRSQKQLDQNDIYNRSVECEPLSELKGHQGNPPRVNAN